MKIKEPENLNIFYLKTNGAFMVICTVLYLIFYKIVLVYGTFFFAGLMLVSMYLIQREQKQKEFKINKAYYKFAETNLNKLIKRTKRQYAAIPPLPKGSGSLAVV